MRLKELNEQLNNERQGMARYKKITTMLIQLNNDKDALMHKAAELKERLDKENTDVNKLEGKSLAAILYSILGTLDQHIGKEQREALAAKLKYDQALKDLQTVNEQLNRLREERATYTHCEHKYNELYRLKKQMLVAQNGEAAKRIMQIEEDISAAKINLKEIGEAFDAGQRVLSALNRVSDELNSAKSYGLWDLAGGGMISGMVKHSHIDDAQMEMEKAQQLMAYFKMELCDVKIDWDIQIGVSGMARFADFFFDGLITDWFIQSKINDSQTSVTNTENQIKDILHKLRLLESREKIHIGRLKQTLDKLVTNE